MIARKILFVAINLIVLSLVYVSVSEWSGVDRFDGVGGYDVYARQRRQQLEDAKLRIGHLDPETQERELVAIDEQIAELVNGTRAGELGDELRRVK